VQFVIPVPARGSSSMQGSAVLLAGSFTQRNGSSSGSNFHSRNQTENAENSKPTHPPAHSPA
jgi:hypothetical protein